MVSLLDTKKLIWKMINMGLFLSYVNSDLPLPISNHTMITLFKKIKFLNMSMEISLGLFRASSHSGTKIDRKGVYWSEAEGRLLAIHMIFSFLMGINN